MEVRLLRAATAGLREVCRRPRLSVRDREYLKEHVVDLVKMIERLIVSSLKGDMFDKAIECLKELRKACVNEDEAPSFNRFAYKIRSQFNKPGDQHNFFRKLIQEQITLITKDESKLSSLVDQ